jgi:hypothetical protein
MSSQPRQCSVDGCERVFVPGRSGGGRGMCGTHYQRWRRGTPLTTPIHRYRVEAIESLREAALAYAEAETADDLDRAERRLRGAAVTFANREAA